MDIKSLTDAELSELQQRLTAEVENRRAAAAAPAMIQQTALRALAAGASASVLTEALNQAISIPAPAPETETQPEPEPEEPESDGDDPQDTPEPEVEPETVPDDVPPEG